MGFIKIITVITFISLLCNCTHEPNSIKEVIKYKNGNIKEKKVILDSNSYLVLKYFDDGVLKDSTPYINSKRNGIRRFYFRDEGYSNWVTYKNDTVNGLVWAKYIDETIYYTGEMKDSLRLGEWFFYHENGNLSEYEFLSRAGTSQYLREYDVEGIYLHMMEKH